MSLHEYQGKQPSVKYGLPVSKGFAVGTPEETAGAYDKIGGGEWVVKVQAHAGGCGRAGGVKLVKSKEDAKAFAQQWLSRSLVTYQTDANDQPVNKILVESCTDIGKKLYLGAVISCSSRRIVSTASTEDGVDVEKIAHDTPEKILKATIDPLVGVQPYQGCKLTSQPGLKGDRTKQFTHIFVGLVKLSQDYDLALLEVSPLMTKKDGSLHCLDAKIGIDSNALYRQSKLRAMHNPPRDDAREAYAQKWELNYVTLKGNIDCMASDAGLAMSAMDIINLHDGKPANFLDVNDGTIRECVTEAFKIILSDSDARAVLVNIFGGIVRCDVIAGNIIGAVKGVGMKIPVVVHLKSNNVELGAEVLVRGGLNITAATGLTDAAQQVVKAVEDK